MVNCLNEVTLPRNCIKQDTAVEPQILLCYEHTSFRRFLKFVVYLTGNFQKPIKEVFMERIGFIGIGLMGRHMSKHLLQAGYPLTVWNRTSEKAQELLDAGASWADSPKAMAKESDVVITMVTDSVASERVICGQNGVLEGAHENLTIIDMGSIAPEMSRSIAMRAKNKGIPMLDAPVTGNPKVAEAGKLGIMVGGPKETFEFCRPIFEKMGIVIVHAGENGMGTTLKLINNLILGVAIEAVSEAMVLATKAGIDPQKVIEITSVGGARTAAMETRGPKMIHRNFSAGFSIDNMYKDLSSAMKLADECGVSIPAASVSLEILRSAKTHGKGNLDSCSVLTVLEQMANTEVKSEK
jgi:3-hydroxyisobutyrate dehydrogenase-like beta-hydroxyacid dehydrogenase